MAEARKRTAVLISGRGSNLGALIDASQKENYPAEISFVLSNVPDAGGLLRAREHNIETATLDHRDFESKAAFEAALDSALRARAIDLICLAGFMRILSPAFVDAWRDRLLNIHPSLLPLYPGLDTHRRALAAGDRKHGATVHFVRAETDQGPIVTQGSVPVLADDTPETLAARVLTVEHQIYPRALGLVAGGRARVVGERVEIDDNIVAAIVGS